MKLLGISMPWIQNVNLMFSLLPCDAPSSWKMQIANKLLLDRFHLAHFMETQQPEPLRISCFCAITLIYLIKTCY